MENCINIYHTEEFDMMSCVPASGRKCWKSLNSRQIIGAKTKIMNFKNKILSLLLTAASSVMLTGCYTDFEPKLESTPVVCINSKIIAGDTIKAEVTRTWRYSEGNPNADGYLDIWLDDAEVSLYVNGCFQEKMDYVEVSHGNHYMASLIDKYFKAEYIPKVGDEIKIVASDKTYGEAYAEVTIPPVVDIIDVDYQIQDYNKRYEEIYNRLYYTIDMRLEVKFKDPADAVNFYLFNVMAKRMNYDPSPGYNHNERESILIDADYEYEPIFSEHITPIETVISDALGLYTMFSDKQISGREYSLSIPVTVSYTVYDYIDRESGAINKFDSEHGIISSLSHISTSYYNYMLSLWTATEGVQGALGDVGLGDAVFEFSNVSTHAGIVTAESYSDFEIFIKDILDRIE